MILNQLIDSSVVSSMATSCGFGSAIQHPLNGEVDIVSLSITGNFDAVGESGDGAMCPTGSAIMRDVLIETFGEVGFAIDVVPVPSVGDGSCSKIPTNRDACAWNQLNK